MQGLNSLFMNNTQQFMDQYTGITASQNLLGTRYALDANFVGSFDLRNGNHGDADLESFGRSLTSPRLFAHAIPAYYLVSHPNASRTIQITNHAQYFFTDTLTGCLFAAYGNNRLSLTVEHYNALTLGAGAVNIRILAIQALNCPVTLFWGPNEYRNHPNMPQGADPMMMISTVAGKFTGNGWVFYGRVRDAGGNHAAVGAQATVI